MATVTWTGREAPDPEASGGRYFQADVDGKKVSILFSAEALEDYGVGACQEMAEKKIEAGLPLEKLRVVTSDFQSR